MCVWLNVECVIDPFAFQNIHQIICILFVHRNLSNTKCSKFSELLCWQHNVTHYTPPTNVILMNNRNSHRKHALIRNSPILKFACLAILHCQSLPTLSLSLSLPSFNFRKKRAISSSMCLISSVSSRLILLIFV